jgi:tetratricopeptide (TPR) repeat protein
MVDTLIEQALEHHRAGRLHDAKVLYQQILEISPQHPDALHLLGLAALQGGDPAGAVDLIRKAASLQPKNWGFRANLAAALFDLKRYSEALSAFREAARLNPDEPQLQMGIANCLAMQGDLPLAESQLRRLTRRHPELAFAWLNLANAVRDQSRTEEAIGFYRRALQIDSNLVDAHNSLGGLLHAGEKFDEAERAYRAAIALAPDQLTGYCNLASLLIDRGRFDEAESVCRQALARWSDSPMLHSLLGAAIGLKGRLIEAIECYRRALVLEPDNARALAALGGMLFETGNVGGGLPLIERAAALDSESPDGHRNLAGAYLALGEFAKGWREYAHRPARATFATKNPGVRLDITLPPTLAGKHVCLAREQGLGDELFFLRYARELKVRGAQVTYRANPKIASILGRVPLLDRVLTDSDPLPAADYTLTVGDLPLALESPDATSRETASPELPPPLRLAPLDIERDAVARRLAEFGPPPYLGITWRGGTPPEEQGKNWGLFKEVPLEALGAAFRNSAGTLLALQRNPRPGEIEQFAAYGGRPVHDLTALNEDLEAMLALLALIDDYIGASNTNMHLRAGVGRIARVLVPCPAEWRWMAKGDESPWFPGFRVYRQTPDGDWAAALAQLAYDLQVSTAHLS